MARDAASHVAAQRQQAVDDLWYVAEDIGLVAVTGSSLCKYAGNSLRRACAVTAVLNGKPTITFPMNMRGCLAHLPTPAAKQTAHSGSSNHTSRLPSRIVCPNLH